MRISYTAVLAIGLASAPAAAVTEAQFDTIRNMGRLNGVALQCKYLGATKRMKQALVETLPKRRELGLAFDDVTNESFVNFIDEGLSCPLSVEFNSRVDSAIDALKEAF